MLGYDQSSTEKMLLDHLEQSNIHNIEIKRLKARVPNEKSSIKMKNLDEHSFE